MHNVHRELSLQAQNMKDKLFDIFKRQILELYEDPVE